MDHSSAVWESQVALVFKCGGNLCAPIPKPRGQSSYVYHIPEATLDQRIRESKEICSVPSPRPWRRSPLCRVGLEDSQAKKRWKLAAAP